MPPALFDRLAATLNRRLESGDSALLEARIDADLASVGLWARNVDVMDRDPLREESDVARWTVMTEEDIEFGLDDGR